MYLIMPNGVSTLLAANVLLHAYHQVLSNAAVAPLAGVQQKRHLNVHEHVSFTLLKKAGIPVPGFGVAHTAEEAVDIAKGLDSTDVVVKAQVLTGGRGKGYFKGGLKGGVKLVYS